MARSPAGSERGPRVRAPLVRHAVWVRRTSPFHWTRGATGIFRAAAPASVGSPHFACGQDACFFAPFLPFLLLFDFLDFFAFLAFLLLAFFALGCAAGAAATVT